MSIPEMNLAFRDEKLETNSTAMIEKWAKWRGNTSYTN
jgi:hypothetical protein